MQHKSMRALLITAVIFCLNGCAAPIALTLLGVGAGVTTGTAVSYTMDGVAYRTFTAPLPRVEQATLRALNEMGMEVQPPEKTDEGKAIKAKGVDRQIEIELEAISSKTTRIRTVAKDGIFFKDRATATEIIMQTERILNKA
ncbi:MAG: DUF3568 family protein [Deltaproteobacteria bacterium]|jgi:hypothetical protein|nr:DUF3568 family protein [Candidatus Binatia bacterium]